MRVLFFCAFLCGCFGAGLAQGSLPVPLNIDLAIKNVQHELKAAAVVVINKGGKPVPVDLTIEFGDGSKKKIHRSAGVWEKGNAEAVISFGSGKTIKKVVLGSTYTSDTHPADNVWPAAH